MIKFRAWDKNENQYFICGNAGTLANLVCSDDLSMMKPDDYIWEQFTGLTDVNGKDVYEGDIIQPIMLYTDRNVGEPFEVKKGNYVYGKWIAKDVSSKGFVVNDYYFSNEIKVSGNAYTNPKLLKGENN